MEDKDIIDLGENLLNDTNPEKKSKKILKIR